MTRTLRAIATIIVAALAIPLAAGAGAELSDGDQVITLTLIRHGESAGNASGLIDTSVPGPDLTELGEAQALMIANRLSHHAYDGVFASSMVRTQQTAEPMGTALSEPVHVLPGLREIEAGAFEGTPEGASDSGYVHTIVDWANGERAARIPGSLSGDEFDARFDAAVEEIYRSGDRNPVAFSHGGAVMAWTLMNVSNSDPALLRQSLPNTGYVVLTGNPNQGWRLTEWNGTPVS